MGKSMKNSMRNLAAGLALVLTAAVSITVGSQVGLRLSQKDAQAAAVNTAGAAAPAEDRAPVGSEFPAVVDSLHGVSPPV